jgi:hypothetical protein
MDSGIGPITQGTVERLSREFASLIETQDSGESTFSSEVFFI